MKKKQYYIEFCCEGQREAYAMQSRVFETASDAEDWVRDEFDYIDPCMSVYLMCMVYSEYDDYDIIQIEQIM